MSPPPRPEGLQAPDNTVCCKQALAAKAPEGEGGRAGVTPRTSPKRTRCRRTRISPEKKGAQTPKPPVRTPALHPIKHPVLEPGSIKRLCYRVCGALCKQPEGNTMEHGQGLPRALALPERARLSECREWAGQLRRQFNPCDY
jgi:hypothetical protein